MSTVWTLFLVLVGVVTRYDGAMSTSLYCDQFYGPDGSMTYGMDAMFIAMPISEYGITWECGTRGTLYIEGYDPIDVVVWDAGRFGPYSVRQPDGTLLPIIADVPTYKAPFAPDLSAKATLILRPPRRYPTSGPQLVR